MESTTYVIETVSKIVEDTVDACISIRSIDIYAAIVIVDRLPVYYSRLLERRIKEINSDLYGFSRHPGETHRVSGTEFESFKYGSVLNYIATEIAPPGLLFYMPNTVRLSSASRVGDLEKIIAHNDQAILVPTMNREGKIVRHFGYVFGSRPIKIETEVLEYEKKVIVKGETRSIYDSKVVSRIHLVGQVFALSTDILTLSDNDGRDFIPWDDKSARAAEEFSAGARSKGFSVYYVYDSVVEVIDRRSWWDRVLDWVADRFLHYDNKYLD